MSVRYIVYRVSVYIYTLYVECPYVVYRIYSYIRSISRIFLREYTYLLTEPSNYFVNRMSTTSRLLPIRLTSKIVPGFGRGSKELGIPTANISRDDLKCDIEFDSLPCGIYWGFAKIVKETSTVTETTTEASISTTTSNSNGGESQSRKKEIISKRGSDVCSSKLVYKAAISIGFNPYYNNKEKTIEPHLIAPQGDPNRNVSSCGETQFDDMYGTGIRLSIVGYLRPELPFEGLEKLKTAIKNDIVETERLCDGTDDFIIRESLWVASL